VIQYCPLPWASAPKETLEEVANEPIPRLLKEAGSSAKYLTLYIARNPAAVIGISELA